MWGAVLVCLLLCSAVFYSLARFHEVTAHINDHRKSNVLQERKKKVTTLHKYPLLERLDSDIKYNMLREMYKLPRLEGEPEGLYQFRQASNSLLYTYSMLLLVSLPKLPTGWSLRMLTGWYWLYCLLLVVAYRASMTAILARPAQRVTIDSLLELVESHLPCGGRGEFNKQFFKTSLEPASKVISERFEIVNDSESAVDRVANGKFAYYENTYSLKEASVKRQLRYQIMRSKTNATNQTQEQKYIAGQDRVLHIMNDCVIKMPISIGLQKNSPLKKQIDKHIRRVVEAGLINKWLDDVMQVILNAEIVVTPREEKKALMDIGKFFGALVALFTGYLISIIVLVVEILYFRHAKKRTK